MFVDEARFADDSVTLPHKAVRYCSETPIIDTDHRYFLEATDYLPIWL
jgi:hypothetical protein